jgi:CheY-like chemotaxis protein
MVILVVDDDPAVLEQARALLNQNRKVLLASDMDRLCVSVVLIDLSLNGKEGLTLIRRVHEILPDLPIIAICGDVQGALAEALRALGVVEFLNKPVVPEWKVVVERIRGEGRSKD